MRSEKDINNVCFYIFDGNILYLPIFFVYIFTYFYFQLYLCTLIIIYK